MDQLHAQRRIALRGTLLLLPLLFTTAPALGTDRFWNVGSGLWSVNGNWSPSGIPAGVDNAVNNFFDSTSGNGGFARLNTSQVPAITSLSVYNSATVTLSNQSLNAGSLLVGLDVSLGLNSTHGALNVLTSNQLTPFPGGMTIVNNLRLGVLSGVGTMSQNAGTVIVGNQIIFGDTRDSTSAFNPFGAYSLSGGLLRAPDLEIGTHVNTSGAFNISGFGTANIGSINVGFQGTGAVNQNGGVINLTDSLTIGSGLVTPPAGNDLYTMSAGSLNGVFTTITRNGVFNYTGGDAFLGHAHLYNNARIDISGTTATGFEMYTLHFHSNDAVIELGNNGMHVFITAFEQLDELRTDIARGYNGGSWTGKGITSSAAAADASHRTGIGYTPFTADGILIKRTFYGDANVDGKVDVTDLGALASGWQSGGYWYTGDFNYNGVVDVSDLGLLASNWQQGVAASPAGSAFDDAVAQVGLGGILIPEPAAAGSLAMVLLAWRRTRSDFCEFPSFLFRITSIPDSSAPV